MDDNDMLEADKPEFWTVDYWNEWAARAYLVCSARQGAGTNQIRSNPVLTFQEYAAGKEYSGKKCDLGIIPSRFIHRSNRMARIYNALIAQDEIDLSKLERAIGLARRVIYTK